MEIHWEQETRIPGLTPVRIGLSKDQATMTARFACGVFPTAEHEEIVRKQLSRYFPGVAIEVHLSCPTLLPDFMERPQEYAERLITRYSGALAGVAPFLREAQWSVKGNSFCLHLRQPSALELLNQRDFSAWMTACLKSVFGEGLPVLLTAPNDLQEDLARLAEDVRRQEEDELVRRLAAEAEKPRAAAPKVLLGKAIRSLPIAIGELTETSGRVTLAGRVIAVELRETKKNKVRILDADITDFTGTVTIKAFLPVEGPVCTLKMGDSVMARGDYQYDTYGKEYLVALTDLQTHELPKRRDEAEHKRVELHCHTQMSQMDGLAAPEALIKRAAEWGQPAIAITDHGVTQAFPEAFAAAKEAGIKLIPGMEGYLVDDGRRVVEGGENRPIDAGIVVLDIETTGLSPVLDRITEIGAARVRDGRIVEEYVTFVDPGVPVSAKITELTGITSAMLEGAPKEAEAVAGLLDFIGGDAVAAHNADFDLAFIRRVAEANGASVAVPIIDTVALAQALLPELKNHRLNSVCRALGVKNERHHRAVQDARATAEVYLKLRAKAVEEGAKALGDLDAVGSADRRLRSGKARHVILLAKTRAGLEHLNQIVSEGHLRFFQKSPPQPRIPRARLAALREGLIVGSACADGELIQAMLHGAEEARLEEIARFYDFLEIQPLGNNDYLVREGYAVDEEALRALNRRIVALGEKLGIPVCATGDVHFLEPHDAVLREILMTSVGFSDAHLQAPLYLRTTEEMLEEFAYLGEETARRVVCENPAAIADSVEAMTLFPVHPQGLPTFQPTIDGAEAAVEHTSRQRACELYGDALPEIVKTRLDRELSAIIGNGFATLYHAAKQLVERSVADGYMVGSRGSVGSSLVAYLLGITEVNPMAPHYLCPACRWNDFAVDSVAYPCGFDLPARSCPDCGAQLTGEGFDIAFEVFLGFEADKVPDIDLNFSGEYQGKAMAFVEEMFGKGNCYRAGTITTLASKTAYGCVKKWAEERDRHLTRAEIDRLVGGLTGVKKTSGQHPGGMVIVPGDRSIYEFFPVQHPPKEKDKSKDADKDQETITTHYDFNSLHDLLVKIDVLGHADPTMLRRLSDLTGIDIRSIPLRDEKVMSLFTSAEALGISEGAMECRTGTLGIPEFGTGFVRGMLESTMPTTFMELVRISGLSHGTDVWLGNAQEIIASGTAELRDCICTRDDILTTLLYCGLDSKKAFDIMERVRKGKGLAIGDSEAMEDAGVPEWFIDSCRKIKYLFPRSHAAAYVTMAARVAWFKVYHPAAYYAAFFSIRAPGFDAALCLGDAEALKANRTRLEVELEEKESGDKERKMTVLDSVLEMRLRGISFLPVDLYKSAAADFVIEDGNLRLPFGCLPKLGENAAVQLERAGKEGPYKSIEDVKLRAKVNTAVLAVLKEYGCLKGLGETSQMSFLDLFD